jgi:hypothetical protein
MTDRFTPMIFEAPANNTLLTALEKAAQYETLSRDERIEIAITRYLVARTLWAAARDERSRHRGL